MSGRHHVLVEEGAGEAAGITDQDYKRAGAEIISRHQEVFEKAQLILKVKEPLPEEYDLLKEEQIIFTFFHFPSNRSLTEAVIRSKCIAIAYENVEVDGNYPLLAPMSKIAGRIAVLQGLQYLQRKYKGKGVLLGGTGDEPEGKIVIIGGGHVGKSAALVASGLGAEVVLLDIRKQVLDQLKSQFPTKNVALHLSSSEVVKREIKNAELIVGAVYSKGRKAPIVITRDMLCLVERGSVIVDVAIDQGGCVETSHPTTWGNPIYEVDSVIHFCVANMPGGFPRTSTFSLAKSTLPFVEEIARKEDAENYSLPLKRGISIYKGKVIHPAISETFRLPRSELN